VCISKSNVGREFSTGAGPTASTTGRISPVSPDYAYLGSIPTFEIIGFSSIRDLLLNFGGVVVERDDRWMSDVSLNWERKGKAMKGNVRIQRANSRK